MSEAPDMEEQVNAWCKFAEQMLEVLEVAKQQID